MIRLPVKSSQLAEVGFDPFQEILEVQFINGSVYEYAHVPAPVYYGLISAESIGTYFAQNIRYQFPTTKIQDKTK
jgi:hypothetical protein